MRGTRTTAPSARRPSTSASAERVFFRKPLARGQAAVGEVQALDQDADELATVSEWFAAMREEGGLPASAEADVKQGDALDLPFADGEFDRIVAAELLAHIPDDNRAIAAMLDVPVDEVGNRLDALDLLYEP